MLNFDVCHKLKYFTTDPLFNSLLFVLTYFKTETCKLWRTHYPYRALIVFTIKGILGITLSL